MHQAIMFFSRQIRFFVVLFIAAFLYSFSVQNALAAHSLSSSKVIDGERLSSWLKRSRANTELVADSVFLSRQYDKEKQLKVKSEILYSLLSYRDSNPQCKNCSRLYEVLQNTPVTGRFYVKSLDPFWLEIHSESDPVLSDSDELRWLAPVSTVSVLNGNGEHCRIEHSYPRDAHAYIKMCFGSAYAKDLDFAWVIQNDGRWEKTGLSNWALETKDSVAAGAIILAPNSASAWKDQFSSALAAYLSIYSYLDSPIHKLPIVASLEEIPSEGKVISNGGLDYTANDFGTLGLLQTPSARFGKHGDLRFTYSMVYPYTRGSFMLQPLDWFEFGFRYTDISNKAYGTAVGQDQSYKDKSIDVKFHILDESKWLPSIALGLVDIGGTGLFSSEYLVGSKRFDRVDVTAGLAWGYLGRKGNLKNPLSILFPSFSVRSDPTAGVTGVANSTSYFHGPAALIGGVEYQPEDSKFSYKVELDGNNYAREPLGNSFSVRSPINVGVVYRAAPGWNFTFGVERGDTLFAALNAETNLTSITPPRLLEAKEVPIFQTSHEDEPDWGAVAMAIQARSQWDVLEIKRGPTEVIVVINEPKGTYWNERIEAITRILHRDSPASIRQFRLSFVARGQQLVERIVLRATWLDERLRMYSAQEYYRSAVLSEPRSALAVNSVWKTNNSPFNVDLRPSYQQNIGGPDGFVLYQVGVSAPMEYRFTDTTWISSSFNLGLLNNYDKFKYDAPSGLPRVRTDLRQYMTTSKFTMPVMQITHAGRYDRNNYYSVYGGYFESMFAGYGAEWLYRPYLSRVALGVDVNRVQQRAYEQNFMLRDYKVNTGHVTLYWDTGWNATHVNLQVGQYLAGDKGATLDVSRKFVNGVSIGAWMTLTNVSKEQFGEGSFDKGIYVFVPFDAMLPYKSRDSASLVWSPLTRDGGARLGRDNRLYIITSSLDPDYTIYDSGMTLDGKRRALYERPDKTLAPIFQEVAAIPGEVLEGSKGSVSSGALLSGAGIVLASSLLDKTGDRVASHFQSGKWDAAGKLGSAIPFLMAGATGMVALGATGSETEAETAWIALKSAATTIGVQLVGKLAVGRARPDQEQGVSSFSMLKTSNANSGFPSMHSGMAFALATPFAQRNDMPWLYGLGAITALSRIQQRQHFFSDVVAGGLLGYGIGSAYLDKHRRIKIGAGPGAAAVQFEWLN